MVSPCSVVVRTAFLVSPPIGGLLRADVDEIPAVKTFIPVLAVSSIKLNVSCQVHNSRMEYDPIS